MQEELDEAARILAEAQEVKKPSSKSIATPGLGTVFKKRARPRGL